MYNGEDYSEQAVRTDFKTRDNRCPICTARMITNCFTIYTFADGRREVHRYCSRCHVKVIYEGCDASKQALREEFTTPVDWNGWNEE